MNRNAGLALGLGLGLVGGAAVALFTSPLVGAGPHELVRQRLDELGARLRALSFEMGEFYARGERVVADARAQIDAAVEVGKAAAEAQRQLLESQT